MVPQLQLLFIVVLCYGAYGTIETVKIHPLYVHKEYKGYYCGNK
jgi:hypothetical protein